MRCVYLIQSLENGYYKIGVSKNPQKRIEQLQTGNSSKLKLISTFKSDYAYKIETALRNTHTSSRKEGEWFDIGFEIETKFIEKCKKLEENFVFLKKNGNVFI